jgi:hypothetical protein
MGRLRFELRTSRLKGHGNQDRLLAVTGLEQESGKNDWEIRSPTPSARGLGLLPKGSDAGLQMTLATGQASAKEGVLHPGWTGGGLPLAVVLTRWQSASPASIPEPARPRTAVSQAGKQESEKASKDERNLLANGNLLHLEQTHDPPHPRSPSPGLA